MNRKSYSLLDEGGRKVTFQELLFGWGQTCKNVHTNQPKTGLKPAENQPGRFWAGFRLVFEFQIRLNDSINFKDGNFSDVSFY